MAQSVMSMADMRRVVLLEAARSGDEPSVSDEPSMSLNEPSIRQSARVYAEGDDQ